MILESIKNSSSNIQYMTTKQRESDEFIKEAIKTNPYVIRWIEQTYELCMFAINIDVTTIGCVHSEIVDMYNQISHYKLIFTKLDETETYGNILNIKLYSNSDLSYVTM